MGKRLLFLGMCLPLLLLPLGAAPTAAGLSFTKIIIDPNPGNIPVEKLMADLNGDGKLDIIIGLEQAGLYWWGFPSSGKVTDPWLKHTIKSTGNFYEDLQPYDLNGDGHVDIIACHDNNMYWYQNPGGDATGAWVEHFLGNGLGHDVRLADIDGDGKIDVVTQYGIYFQNNPDSWSFKSLGSLKGLALLDIGSGKGAINLVLNTASGVTWYENPRESGGDARTGNWTARVIDSSTGAEEQPLAGGFISNDGRMHLIGNPPNQGLVWWQAPADRRNGQWIKHVINSTYQDIHKIVVVDIDKNGSPDLVVAEQEQSHDPVGGPYTFNNDRVSIFYNNGAAGFSEQVLETTGGQNNVVGDVDGDGDLDILNVNHGFYGAPHPIELFVNNTNSGGAPPPPPPPPPPSGQAPWGGTAATIPGTFQAENYDTGGEGVAYHDLDGGNQGGQYRPNEGVDIGTSTHAGGNGFSVGWCQAGEWIDYTVNVTAAGTYTLAVPVALPFPGGTFHIEFGGVDKTGAFSVPNTGGADTWQTITKTVSLSAGQQVMRVVMDSNGSAGWVTNLDFFTFTSAGGAPPPPPSGQGSLSGSTGGAAAGYNLTSLGTTDWVHWGRGGTYGNVDRKSSGGGQISAVSVAGSGANSGGWSDSGRSVSWSDGTPTGSVSNDHGYIWSNGALGTGFSFTAPADPSSRTLNVYFGASTATCTLSAHLSDGSAADYSTTQTGPGAWFATLTYTAASAGQTLTVRLTKTGNNPGFTDGSADLDSATLQASAGSSPPAPPPAPPPSSGNLMKNPSFESDPSTDYFPYGSGTFSWATDAAHSGTHSVKIVSVQPSGTLTRWLSDTTSIGAVAGNSYTATAWFKTLNATDHGVLTINFWNSASQVLAGMDGGTITGSTDWTSLSVSGTAPAGTAFIRVEFRLWGSGTLWADDASLIQN